MAKRNTTNRKSKESPKVKGRFSLPIGQLSQCPLELLRLDVGNPRLQTGNELSISTDNELLRVLVDIAAIDELVTSICTNKYLNLEPLIVIADNAHGPFRVLEGNRRLAAIKLIRDPSLADELGVKIPSPIRADVIASTDNLLVHRVAKPDDARAFIGFKHINGPQRWDAYAKARYVTEWYKNSPSGDIDEIAAKMGDNNKTLRSYIYSILMLEQAEEAGAWSIKDRANVGRFAFSHLYTALGRKEYQDRLGFVGGWTAKPSKAPLEADAVGRLAEILKFIYGSKSEDRPALVKSQNPDLKFLGEALANPRAYSVLANRGTLDEALDEMKDPSVAFQDALTSANLRLKRAVGLMPKYRGGSADIDRLVDEIYEQADTIKTNTDKKRKAAN
jgi:hypothetical protein